MMGCRFCLLEGFCCYFKTLMFNPVICHFIISSHCFSYFPDFSLSPCYPLSFPSIYLFLALYLGSAELGLIKTLMSPINGPRNQFCLRLLEPLLIRCLICISFIHLTSVCVNSDHYWFSVWSGNAWADFLKWFLSLKETITEWVPAAAIKLNLK